MITFEIPGEPMAQPRPRATVVHGHAVIYNPKLSRDWKATAHDHMQQALAGRPPLQEAVQLHVIALFTCPRSHWRKRDPLGRRWHIQRPDGDNVLKAVKDAAKGVLWLDDSQVCSETIEKYFAAQGEAPGIQVALSPAAAIGDPSVTAWMEAWAAAVRLPRGRVYGSGESGGGVVCSGAGAGVQR